jgi:hypothetical protein
MRILRFALSASLFLIGTVPLCAQGTYTQIDYPGAVATYGYGINSAGDVVGDYVDASDIQHGFLMSGGTFTTIDNPIGGWTWISGINDHGTVVGYGGIAFLYDIQSKVFTNIGIGGLETTPLGINNADTVVGFVISGRYHAHQTGFELSAQGQTTRIKVMDAESTLPWGVSTSGLVVGYGFLGDYSDYSFSFDSGKSKFLTIADAPNAIVLGINTQGTAVVGWYSPLGVESGFLFQNNTR